MRRGAPPSCIDTHRVLRSRRRGAASPGARRQMADLATYLGADVRGERAANGRCDREHRRETLRIRLKKFLAEMREHPRTSTNTRTHWAELLRIFVPRQIAAGAFPGRPVAVERRQPFAQESLIIAERHIVLVCCFSPFFAVGVVAVLEYDGTNTALYFFISPQRGHLRHADGCGVCTSPVLKPVMLNQRRVPEQQDLFLFPFCGMGCLRRTRHLFAPLDPKRAG